jgi:CRISPR-associated protein Cas2
MKAFGYPMQYSVFICDLDSVEKTSLRLEVGIRMNQREDSVLLVDLGDPSTRGVDCFEFMGARPPLPGGGPTIV